MSELIGCRGEVGDRWEMSERWSARGRFFFVGRRVARVGSNRTDEEAWSELDWSNDECKVRCFEGGDLIDEEGRAGVRRSRIVCFARVDKVEKSSISCDKEEALTREKRACRASFRTAVL